MRQPVYHTKFGRDVKKAQRRAYDMQRLKDVIILLLNEAPLPVQYKDHALTGNWKGFRELHIAPDWLLIYQIKDDTCIFARTGTHSDLFSK